MGNEKVNKQSLSVLFFTFNCIACQMKTIAAPSPAGLCGIISSIMKLRIPGAWVRIIFNLRAHTPFLANFERRASPEDWNSADFTSLLSDSFTNLACVFHGGVRRLNLCRIGIPDWLSGKI
jgi:hypothetical protein